MKHDWNLEPSDDEAAIRELLYGVQEEEGDFSAFEEQPKESLRF